MKLIQGTTDIRFDFPTAVTLGKFDGLHRGHQKLIHALKDACGPGQKTVVFTFDVSPAILLKGGQTAVITTKEEKRGLMEAMGVDILIEYPFTEETSHMEAEDFVRGVLADRLNMKTLAVGPDCGFGYRRGGNARLLEQLSSPLGYALHVIEKERTRKDNQVISSSRVKDELMKGDIEEANRLLGYLYSIKGQLDREGSRVWVPLEAADGVWMASQEENQYKLSLPEGRYYSKVWFGDEGVTGITEISHDSPAEGKMLTNLNRSVVGENRCFTPEISLIAQVRD